MERRLAAILAADIVGYSQLMGEDEAGTYDALRSVLAEVVLPTIQSHGGEVFKTTGDGFLAGFGSAVRALEAAVAIQDAVAPRPLRWRMGINLGDVIAADSDMFGDAVNVAARLESMAEPGDILLSGPVVRSIGKRPGVESVRLGPKRAKNITEPIEVYAARRGEPVAGPRRPWPRQRRLAAAAAVAILAAASAV